MLPAPPSAPAPRGTLTDPPDLVRLLLDATERDPAALAFTFCSGSGGRVRTATRGDLAAQVGALAAVLRERRIRGERVVLLLPEGIDYVAALFACFATGALAVPLYPPAASRGREGAGRLDGILSDCSPRVLLVRDAAAASRVREYLQGSAHSPEVLAIDEVEASSPEQLAPTTSEVAYLQYTSGSTARPRGAVIRHSTALANVEQFTLGALGGRSGPICMWVPPFHDFGLVMGVLVPVYLGVPGHLLPPRTFLRHPLAWLRRICQTRSGATGAPDFAYLACVERSTPEERQGLDLSCLEVALNGAEPVRPRTLRLFTDAFGPHGLGAAALRPAYGLAEATLFVTCAGPSGPRLLAVDGGELERGRARKVGPEEPGARLIASSGRSAPSQDLRVVDPGSGEELAEGEIGEIWLSGPHVAHAYWGADERSLDTFGASLGAKRGYLRTGDLGFVLEGDLFVTGRRKDLIVIRGRNLHPQDLELAAEMSHPALRTSASAAFSVDVEDEERIVVLVARARDTGGIGAGELLASVRRSLQQEFGVDPFEVALLPAGRIPRTTSGKVQRWECRRRYLAGELPIEEGLRGRGGPTSPSGPPGAPRELLGELCRSWAGALQREAVGPDEDFFELGGESVAAITLLEDVHARTGRRFEIAALIEAPTPRAMASLVGEEREGPPLGQTTSVHASGRRTPLFGIGGFHGNAFRVLALGRRLGEDQPVLGLEPPGFDWEVAGCRTLEEMGAWYAEEMQRHQGRGPYRLLGASFGGLLAFEAARELQGRGEDVELLAMLDTGPTAGLPSLVANHRLSAEPPPQDGSVETAGLRVRAQYVRAALEYTPSGRFRGDLVYCLCTGTSPVPERDLRRRWERRIDGEVRLHPVSGFHGTFHQEPQASEVQEILDGYLRGRPQQALGWDQWTAGFPRYRLVEGPRGERWLGGPEGLLPVQPACDRWSGELHERGRSDELALVSAWSRDEVDGAPPEKIVLFHGKRAAQVVQDLHAPPWDIPRRTARGSVPGALVDVPVGGPSDEDSLHALAIFGGRAVELPTPGKLPRSETCPRSEPQAEGLAPSGRDRASGSSRAARRSALLVLGMHRSGTSAMTRVLSLCGARLPEHLLPPQPDNPRGFWEPEPMSALLDEALARANSTWRDVLLLPDSWLCSPSGEEVRARLVEVLRREYGDAPLFVLKDPRVCRLLGLVTGALSELGADPAVVLQVRNPLEVVASLSRPGDPSRAEALLSWTQHMLLAERESRHLPRTFVRFDELLADWQSVVERVGQVLPEGLGTSDTGTIEAVEAFLADEMRHHRMRDEDVLEGADVPPWVSDVYRWFLLATDGRSHPPDPGVLDRVHRELSASDRALGPVLRKAVADCAAARKDLEVARSRAARAQRQVEACSARARQARGEAEEHRERAQSAQRRAYRSDQIAAERLARVRDLEAAVAEAEQSTSEQRAERRALGQALDARNASLRRLESHLAAAQRSEQSAKREVQWLSSDGYRLLGHHLRAPSGRRTRLRGALEGLLASLLGVPGDRRLPVRLLRPVGWLLSGRLRTRLAEWSRAYRLSRAGLFDERDYLERYPDVAESGAPAILHYVRHGSAERRRGHRAFDPDRYLAENPDVEAAGLDPLLHLAERAVPEGRSLAAVAAPCLPIPDEQPRPPRIWVVVQGARDASELATCLEGLRAQEPLSGGWRGLVLDDGAGDDQVDLVRVDFPEFELVRCELQEIRGNHPILRAALEARAEYLAVVPAKGELPSDWLRVAVAAAQLTPETERLAPPPASMAALPSRLVGEVSAEHGGQEPFGLCAGAPFLVRLSSLERLDARTVRLVDPGRRRPPPGEVPDREVSHAPGSGSDAEQGPAALRSVASATTQASVLVVTQANVAASMSGMGIRYSELARQLAREHRVVLAAPAPPIGPAPDVRLIGWDRDREALLRSAREADVVLTHGTVLERLPELRASLSPTTRLVVDLSCPFVLENLELYQDRGLDLARREEVHARDLGVTVRQVEAADHLLVANQRQHDWALGMLTALGKVSPTTCRPGRAADELISLVPFGVPDDPPGEVSQASGIRARWGQVSQDDLVLLWGGGLWSWLDPLTVIRAMELVSRSRSDVKLVFLSTEPAEAGQIGMPLAGEAVGLARELCLIDRTVLFNDAGHVPYAKRSPFFLDADVGVSAHGRSLEAHLASRIRLLDSLHHGLPVLTSRGCEISELVERQRLGRVLPVGDVRAWAEAILDLARDRSELRRLRRRVQGFRPRLSWRRAARPLLTYCRSCAIESEGTVAPPPLPATAP